MTSYEDQTYSPSMKKNQGNLLIQQRLGSSQCDRQEQTLSTTYPNQSGYLPPHQYLDNLNEDLEESTMRGGNLIGQIRDINSHLKHGNYGVYYSWLYFNLIFSILRATAIMVLFIYQITQGSLNILPYTLAAVWIILPYFVETETMKKRSLHDAVTGMVLFPLSFIVLVTIEIILYNDYYLYKRSIPKDDDHSASHFWAAFLILMMVLVAIESVVQLMINLIGAVNVWKLLRKRDSLQSELKLEIHNASHVDEVHAV